jgi:hypothetical protein
MGIYPDRWNHDNYRLPDGGGEAWIESERTPGLVRRRQVIATEWTEIRTDCFCCSCGEREGDDGACRNHGGYGQRPCEKHNMPGQPWQDTDDMPESVQVYRRKRELRESRLEIERDGA